MASSSTSIAMLLNDIRQGSLVLPDLQRDFVWKENDIRLLFDSLLRGYPFGSLLFWNTQFLELPYKLFVTDFHTGQTFDTRMKPVGEQRRMVLDGQQRLQSLYLGVFGSLNGRRLYFNVTSGPASSPNDDDDDDDDAIGTGRNYRFEFWRDDEANRPLRLIRVADVLSWPGRREDDEIDEVVAAIGLEGKEAQLARRNLRLVRQVVTDANLVAVETIDQDVLSAEQARQIPEVLEIFVRVNSGGTRLSRSDLMFSLIKTRQAGARHAFDKLVGEVDPGHLLGIDKDFVIKGLLTVADKPLSFDVKNVERHWDDASGQFDAFAAALRVAVDFCRAPDVGIRAASLLSPVNTLLPLVYYLSRRPRGSVPEAQRRALRTVLYFLLFNGFVNSDARIRYLREVFERHAGEPVPLEDLLAVVANRQKYHAVATTPAMLQGRIHLTLNIAQPDAARETLSWQEEPQIDHVFPQAQYRMKHGDLVDDIGNLAYLGRLRNIWKTDQAPLKYFADIPDEELRDQVLIPERKLLAEDQFTTFVERRRALIVEKVRGFLGR